MAKFPTEVERSVTVQVPLAVAHAYLWDVVGSSACIPGLQRCEQVGEDTYRFTYAEHSTGPVSLVVRYTARYTSNGVDQIAFEGIGATDDNTDVNGSIQLRPSSAEVTRIRLRQMVAPETPIPRLLQSLIRSFVESEAADATRQYLSNIKRTLEGSAKRAGP